MRVVHRQEAQRAHPVVHGDDDDVPEAGENCAVVHPDGRGAGGESSSVDPHLRFVFHVVSVTLETCFQNRRAQVNTSFQVLYCDTMLKLYFCGEMRSEEGMFRAYFWQEIIFWWNRLFQLTITALFSLFGLGTHMFK